jgi:hypothetical protein
MKFDFDQKIFCLIRSVNWRKSSNSENWNLCNADSILIGNLTKPIEIFLMDI